MKRIFLALAFLLIASGAEAANRFGVCSTACTWDGSSTAMWSTTTGGSTGASVPGSADAVIFDANTCVGGTTCTITVNTNFSVQSVTLGACTASTTGCILDFTVNNNSPTISQTFSLSGTGTRNVKLGSGTFHMTSVGFSYVDFSTSTNLTFNAGTSTFSLEGTPLVGAPSFTGGGQTFNAITVASGLSGGYDIKFTGAGTTVTTLTANGKANLNFGANYTITTLNINGTSSSPVSLRGTPNTLTVTSSTITWCPIANIVFSGSAVSATNSLDLGGNNMNGGSITAPSTGGGGGGHIIGG